MDNSLLQSLEYCQKKIGYRFAQVNLLEQALTHRSASPMHNERLEFLGDAVLSLIIGFQLYQQFPTATEGQLSHIRMSLVKGDTLAKVAEQLNLGDALILGVGERKSGGKRRKSILEDVLEAIIGAVYLDSDFTVCSQVVLPWFQPWLAEITLQDNVRDDKSFLQELLQARKLSLPSYEILRIEGEEHQQTFVVSCTLDELNITVEGQGTSRKRAEQMAAKVAIEAFKVKLGEEDA